MSGATPAKSIAEIAPTSQHQATALSCRLGAVFTCVVYSVRPVNASPRSQRSCSRASPSRTFQELADLLDGLDEGQALELDAGREA